MTELQIIKEIKGLKQAWVSYNVHTGKKPEYIKEHMKKIKYQWEKLEWVLGYKVEDIEDIEI